MLSINILPNQKLWYRIAANFFKRFFEKTSVKMILKKIFSKHHDSVHIPIIASYQFLKRPFLKFLKIKPFKIFPLYST